MHRRATRSMLAALAAVPVATRVALVALAVAVGVVELGWRDPTPGIMVAVPVPGPLAGPVERMRSLPQQHVAAADAGAVAAGVVFGRADDVSSADQQAFLDSGLWHLLAASGQNVALVAGCCIVLARMLGAGRTTGAVLALAAIPLYVLVVGGGASIVRAGLTGMLAIVAWLAGRLPDARHLLVVVAAATCWTWPGAHRGLGMQLSFACVAALVVWAVPLTGQLTRRGVPTWLAAGVGATLLCSAATAPILQLRTGSAPLAGIVANVVAVPLAGALLVVGLAGASAAALLAPLTSLPVGQVLLAPAGLLADALLQVARRAAALPAASSTSAATNVGVPLVVLAAVLLARRVEAPRSRRRVAIVALAACTLLAGSSLVPASPTSRAVPAPAAPGVLRIASLDVGQGDATLLAIDDHALLVDVGPPRGRVVDRVRELGVDRVDGIVLTHDSLDHRGGYDHARVALDAGWIARPRAAPGPWRHVEETAPRLVDLCAGDRLALGTASIDVLHPRCDGSIVPRTGDLHNDGALVLLVTHGGVRALLPADAEAPVLVGLGLPSIDLLRVAHHGSADPQLAALLARTTPRAATISVGDDNSYGHPTRQVLVDLRAAGTLVRRTDRHGTIVFDSDGRRLSILE